MEGAEPRAYFEDLNRGTLVKVDIGDTLARGRITGIDIDAVAYDHGERGLTWVQVGRDLTGSVSAVAQSSQSTTALLLAREPILKGVRSVSPWRTRT